MLVWLALATMPGRTSVYDVPSDTQAEESDDEFSETPDSPQSLIDLRERTPKNSGKTPPAVRTKNVGVADYSRKSNYKSANTSLLCTPRAPGCTPGRTPGRNSSKSSSSHYRSRGFEHSAAGSSPEYTPTRSREDDISDTDPYHTPGRNSGSSVRLHDRGLENIPHKANAAGSSQDYTYSPDYMPTRVNSGIESPDANADTNTLLLTIIKRMDRQDNELSELKQKLNEKSCTSTRRAGRKKDVPLNIRVIIIIVFFN